LNRKLFLLNGLAILGVVISHAAGWGQIAMYDWADHIRSAVDPNYNPVGGLAYYVLIIIRLVFTFSVAAFLYVSAWYLTYAVGKQSTLSWKVVRMRIVTLLIPYLIWSAIVFGSDIIVNHVRYSVSEYIYRLLLLGADGPYYFVPLLCYLYLLSPFFISWARNRWKLLLLVTGVIQVAAMAFHYLRFISNTPVVIFLCRITPDQSVPRWIFYFTFGLVSGFHATQFKTWSEKIRWAALATCITMLVLAVVEYDTIYRITVASSPTHKGVTWGPAPLTLFTTLYSLAFIIYFQTLNINQFRFSKVLYQLGNRSYGIYLTHYKSMEFVARLVYHFATIILMYQIVYQPILWIFGLGMPLFLMFVVENTPVRRYNRLIFG
jgi:peptidoglycan/LPS O-acetylase OafA/YrhL